MNETAIGCHVQYRRMLHDDLMHLHPRLLAASLEVGRASLPSGRLQHRLHVPAHVITLAAKVAVVGALATNEDEGKFELVGARHHALLRNDVHGAAAHLVR